MEREALTIRFPADLLIKAKKIKGSSESLNDLVVEALEREVSRRRGWAAHQRIIARSETVKAMRVRLRSFGRLMLHWLGNSYPALVIYEK
jgi:hypothetical protein